MSRKTGQTTKQMQALAKYGAFLIAGNVNYYQRLAKILRREDIKIIPLGRLQEEIAGQSFTDFDIDHRAVEVILRECNENNISLAKELYETFSRKGNLINDD